MTKRTWTVAGLAIGVLGLSLLVLSPASAPADDKKPVDDPKVDKTTKANKEKEAETVRLIHLATELAQHGREHNSGLELLTAAALFRQTGVVPSKTKPKVELPEGMTASDEDDKEVAPLSMKAEAKRLFKEAQDLAKEKKDDLLQKLIQEVSSNEEKGTRGGSPRSYTRQIRRGVTHTYTVTMTPGTPCVASVTGNGKNTFSLSVVGAGGVRHGGYTGANPSISWNAGRQPTWVVSVTNDGPGLGSYTLYHN